MNAHTHTRTRKLLQIITKSISVISGSVRNRQTNRQTDLPVTSLSIDPERDVDDNGKHGEGGEDDEDADHVGDVQLRRRLFRRRHRVIIVRAVASGRPPSVTRAIPLDADISESHVHSRN